MGGLVSGVQVRGVGVGVFEIRPGATSTFFFRDWGFKFGFHCLRMGFMV